MKELLNQLKESQTQVSILGRGLTYAVDLKGSTKTLGNRLSFDFQGKIRFAVFKSDGRISSTYDLGQKTNLVEHEIKFDKINFREHYKFSGDSFEFEKRGKPPTIISIFENEIMDPTPLVFKLMTLDQTQNYDERGSLFIGGKAKKFHFKKTDNDFVVNLNDKQLFSGTYKGGAAHISISTLKIKLKVEKL